MAGKLSSLRQQRRGQGVDPAPRAPPALDPAPVDALPPVPPGAPAAPPRPATVRAPAAVHLLEAHPLPLNHQRSPQRGPPRPASLLPPHPRRRLREPLCPVHALAHVLVHVLALVHALVLLLLTASANIHLLEGIQQQKQLSIV